MGDDTDRHNGTRTWRTADISERVNDIVAATKLIAIVAEHRHRQAGQERYIVAWDLDGSHSDVTAPDGTDTVTRPRDFADAFTDKRHSDWYLICGNSRWLLELAASMPPDVTLDLDTLPSRSGVIAFTDQIDSPGADGQPCPLHAITWHTLTERNQLYVGFYAEMDNVVAGVGFSLWSNGLTVADTSDSDGDPNSHQWDRRVLAAAWHLAGRADTATVVEADRAQRRRARRAGTGEPPALSIIGAAQPDTAATAGTGAQRGEPTGHWWVRAHWRSVPYGPNKTLRRPTLIAAHLAGNREGPDVSRQRVIVARDNPDTP